MYSNRFSLKVSFSPFVFFFLGVDGCGDSNQISLHGSGKVLCGNCQSFQLQKAIKICRIQNKTANKMNIPNWNRRDHHRRRRKNSVFHLSQLEFTLQSWHVFGPFSVSTAVKSIFSCPAFVFYLPILHIKIENIVNKKFELLFHFFCCESFHGFFQFVCVACRRTTISFDFLRTLHSRASFWFYPLIFFHRRRAFFSFHVILEKNFAFISAI